MVDYRFGPHSLFAIHLHLPRVTKYSKEIWPEEVAIQVHEIIQEIWGAHDVQIMSSHASRDHLHLFVSMPPQVATSRLVQKVEGRTAFKLLHENAMLRKQYLGRYNWGRQISGTTNQSLIKEFPNYGYTSVKAKSLPPLRPEPVAMGRGHLGFFLNDSFLRSLNHRPA